MTQTTKKKPQRKCVGCGMVREQSLLVRVVRMPDRSFAIERNMKLNGRGAYLCDNVACLEKAVKKRGLDRSFREKIDAAVYEQLAQEIGH